MCMQWEQKNTNTTTLHNARPRGTNMEQGNTHDRSPASLLQISYFPRLSIKEEQNVFLKAL